MRFSLVLIFFISLPVFADDANKFLRCARNLLETGKVNDEVYTKLGVTIDRFTAKNAKDSWEFCKILKEESAELPKQKVFDAYLTLLSVPNHAFTIKARELMIKMVYPNYKCNVVGAEVKAFVVGGVGVGADIGSCTGESGRTFAMIILSSIWGVGLGAMANIEVGHLELERDEVFLMNSGVDVGLGIMIGGAGEGYHHFYHLGVGAGFALEYYDRLAIRFLPLGSTTHGLKKLLLADQEKE